jgi:hypothetical protein
MGDSFLVLFRFAAARPGGGETAQFFRPPVEDAEVQVEEAKQPIAVGGRGDADGFANEGLADEDKVTARCDRSVGAYAAHRVLGLSRRGFIALPSWRAP